MESVLPVGDLPDGIPLDGFQYLALVRQKASTIPDILYVKSKTPTSQTHIEMEARQEIEFEIPETLKPSKGWIDARLKDYHKLRTKKRTKISKVKMSEWLEYFTNNTPKTMSMNQPTTLKLLQLSSDWIDSGADIPNIKLLPWIYALLVQCELLLEADEISLLRTLMKQARQLRIQNIEDHPIFVGCTLIIVIIGNVFGQKDLLD